MRKKKIYDADLFVTGEYPRSGNALIKNKRIIKVFRRWNIPEGVPDKLPLHGCYGRRWFTHYAFFYDEEGLWFIAGRKLIKVTEDLQFSYKSNPLCFYFRIMKDNKTIYRKFGIQLEFIFLLFDWIGERDDDENFFHTAYNVFSHYDPTKKRSPVVDTFLLWSRRSW